MSDDHATNAISAYGSRINETPHLDRIAGGGMRFDSVFVPLDLHPQPRCNRHRHLQPRHQRDHTRLQQAVGDVPFSP